MKTNAAPQPAALTELTIIVCTYHRETMLAGTLASIAAQRPTDSLDVRVLVVDNSDEGTALGVVERSLRASPFRMQWAPAHPANIAIARNVGVELAATEYIAFVDDDNALKPGWLEAVAKALGAHPHDVFFGAYDAAFERPERATRATRQVFSRRLDAASGSDLFAMGRRQTRHIALGTNNTIIRRAALPSNCAPFDISFGHGGGEDYDLFCRMQRAGHRFGWLPEAQCHEFVTAARCEPSYLRRRFFVGGQTFAAGASRASAHPRLKRWWLRVKALMQALSMSAAFPAIALRGRAARLDHIYRLAGVWGKLSFGEIYPIYRRTAGASGQSGSQI